MVHQQRQQYQHQYQHQQQHQQQCNSVVFKSAPIQVLSYRLFHAPKVSSEKLKPSDSVAKMKGIGALYAKRLKSLGINTVEQLASMDIDLIGEEGCKRLIASLRKDRGSMTVDKLHKYIEDARDIVTRHTDDRGNGFTDRTPTTFSALASPSSCSSGSPLARASHIMLPQADSMAGLGINILQPTDTLPRSGSTKRGFDSTILDAEEILAGHHTSSKRLCANSSGNGVAHVTGMWPSRDSFQGHL